MAAELLRYYGTNDFEVESAGVRPQPLPPEVLAVLAEHDIETRRLQSKHVNELQVHAFDEIISLCDRHREPCPTCDDAIATVCSNFPDPTALHQQANSSPP
jgi:arsenate reductase